MMGRALLDFQPVGHVIGRLTAALGAAMMIPAALDLLDQNDGWRGLAISAVLTISAGWALALLLEGDRSSGMTRRHTHTLVFI